MFGGLGFLNSFEFGSFSLEFLGWGKDEFGVRNYGQGEVDYGFCHSKPIN